MAAVASIALSTSVVFGIGTVWMIRAGRVSFMEAAAIFIFGLSMAGTSIGAAFLAGGNAATKVVGSGAKSVEHELGSEGAGGGMISGATSGGAVGGQATPAPGR